MEKQYNQLLSLSKTVSDFYENVYAPVLQTLPWLDEEDGLKIASEKVLGNIAFPAYELSNYKKQGEDKEAINHLRTRCDELNHIYEKMQSELHPLLSSMPAQDRTWKNLQEMIPKWKNLSSSDLLPHSTHKAVHKSFASLAETTSHVMILATSEKDTHPTSNAEEVLAKLMAAKIKAMHHKGETDSAIALNFGSHGFWLDRGFINRIR